MIERKFRIYLDNYNRRGKSNRYHFYLFYFITFININNVREPVVTIKSKPPVST